jgi:hypothetical protein
MNQKPQPNYLSQWLSEMETAENQPPDPNSIFDRIPKLPSQPALKVPPRGLSKALREEMEK